jgi:DHA1 family bicyclomycin/chloramphenicol resistance-like MFS transporter
MYLPALPGMVEDFDSNTSRVQLTLSSYLVGFAVFHLLCGPLADRYGRKPVLVGGVSLFVAASLGCAQAGSIDELIFYRFLQGVGACVGPTLGRAIARDIFGPRRAARALAQIAMIMALAPAVAPTLGGILLQFFQWPAIFIVLAIYALAAILAVATRLPESLPERQSLHPVEIGRNYLALLRSGHFLATTCASSMMYAAMIAFLSGSSFVFIDMMGVSTATYGLLFLPTVVGYIAGNGISTRLVHGREPEQIMLIGVQLGLAGAFCMIVASELLPDPLSIVLPMSLYSTALGIVLPHAMASALRPFPQIAGTASALLGFIQMGLSSLGGALVGALLVDSPRPMVLLILAMTGVSYLLIKALQRR